MKKFLRFVLRVFRLMPFFLMQSTFSQSDGQRTPQEFIYKTMSGAYEIYGGSLGDTSIPTKDDAKVSFTLKGKVAREMFEKMGGDLKNECPSEPREGLRAKENLECRRTRAGVYSCSFGFDLRTGKSIGGIIC